jgi:hypothetical protein
MMRLFITELRRSLTQLTTIVILAVFGLGLIGSFFLIRSEVTPPTAAQIADGQARLGDALEQWNFDTEFREAQIATCLEDGDAATEAECARLMRPTLQKFIWAPTVAEVTERDQHMIGFLFALLVCVAIAATVAWTDFLTGSISNQLTFTPGRIRVLSAKLGATALLSALVATLAQAAVIGFPWLARHTFSDGVVEPYSDDFWERFLTGTAYQIGVVVVVAVIVAALTHLFRNILPVIGIGAVIVAVTSMNLPPDGWARFLPESLLNALFTGKVEYSAFDRATLTFADPVVVLTRTDATWIVAAVLVVVLAITYWRFQVRDVTD